MNCESVCSCVFPIEVWERIFYFSHDPIALRKTCKYLLRVSQTQSVGKVILLKCNSAPGWYSFAFGEYELRKQIVKYQTLALSGAAKIHFEYNDTPRDELRVNFFTLNYNVLYASFGTCYPHFTLPI